MACKILGNVLPLSVRMGRWFLGDTCAVLSSAVAVSICIVNADCDRVGEANRTANLMRAKFSYDDRALSNV